MKYKYLLGLILLVVSTASKAQQNNTTVFQAWADQQVCITGEEIWIDGYVS